MARYQLKEQPENYRFTLALTNAVVQRMKSQDIETLNELLGRIPDYAAVKKTSLYRTMRCEGRPAVYIMYHVALALGTTLDYLVSDAMILVDSGKKLKTGWELIKDNSPAGRGRVKDDIGRLARKRRSVRGKGTGKPTR